MNQAHRGWANQVTQAGIELVGYASEKPNWSVCLSLIKLTDYGSTISYMWNSVMRGLPKP